MSLFDKQKDIELHYNKSRIVKMIEKDIDSTPEIVTKIDKCIEMLESTYLMGPHFNQKNQYLAGIRSHLQLTEIIYRVLVIVMPLPKGLTFSAVVGQAAGAAKLEDDKLSEFKITSSVISYMYYAGLIKIIRADDSKSGMMEIIPMYVCDQKILDHIKETMYLPPMICAPQKLLDNTSSAYLTVNNDKVILKDYNFHTKEICLDSINTFNSVAYSLDMQMLTTFDEQPKKIIDTHEKQIQFNKLREDSYHVYKLLIQHGNNFHFAHKVDKRGRTYCQGYHVSTQGNSFRKAILNLWRKEIVNGTFN